MKSMRRRAEYLPENLSISSCPVTHQEVVDIKTCVAQFSINYNIRVIVKTKIYSRQLRYRSNLVDSLLHSDPTALIFVIFVFQLSPDSLNQRAMSSAGAPVLRYF